MPAPATLGSVDIRRFGGLQLSSDPSDVSMEQALEATNVELAPDLSFVRTRGGLTRLGNVAAVSGSIQKLLDSHNTGATYAISNDGTNIYFNSFVIGGAPATFGSWAANTVIAPDAVSFGTPTTSYVFIASDVGALMRRFTPSGPALAASVGAPRFLAVMPRSNRLVQGYFTVGSTPTGVNGSSSTVFFSDKGAPETYSANNYVHLRPGDGEGIRGMITWRDKLFVFKESTMYVFSYESVDPISGGPVFDYQAVSLAGRIPPQLTSPLNTFLIGASDKGVYYVSTLGGVYLTTGGSSTKVSGALDEVFSQQRVDQQPVMLSATRFRVAVSTASAGVMYTMDERNGQWVKWTSGIQMPSAPLIDQNPRNADQGTLETLMWGSGNGTMYYYGRAAATDDAANISSSYQTGFGDLGGANVKTVKRMQAYGTGTVLSAMATDYGSADTGASLVLGTAPTAAIKFDTRARRGTVFSSKLSAASGAWQVNRLTMHVRSPRPIGAKI